MSAVRPAVLVQGPVLSAGPGRSTLEVLDGLGAAPSRADLQLLYVAWDDEDPDVLRQLGKRVDRLVLARKPERSGLGNRWMQAMGVQAGLHALGEDGVTHVLKTRSDVAMDETFLTLALRHFRTGGRKLLVTDMFTRLEPFHLSDFVVGSTLAHVGDFFETRPTYYEDAYSPEVQFTRCFVRNQHLRYSMRLESWLRFLRDWVELVGFSETGLRWVKHEPVPRPRLFPYGFPALADRDAGPLLCTPLRLGMHRWLQRTSMPLPIVSAAIRAVDPLVEIAMFAIPDGLHGRLRSPFHRYWVAPGVPESMQEIVGKRIDPSVPGGEA